MDKPVNYEEQPQKRLPFEGCRKPFTRERSIQPVDPESKTDRSQGNETDVNKIIARFARTGALPPPTREPQYADVTGLQKELTVLIEEGKEALGRVKDAQEEHIAKLRQQQHDKVQAMQDRIKELEAAASPPPEE